MRLLLPLALALGAVLASPRPALANMAKAVLEGERSGVLVPDGATAVRVDHETLGFTIEPTLASAVVTVAYDLTSTGPSTEAADIAFTYVRGESTREAGPGEHAAIELDGAPLPFRTVSDADLLRPRLAAWFADHVNVTEALQANTLHVPTSLTELRRRVEAAGGRCASDCPGLVAWYQGSTRDPEDVIPAVEEDEVVRAAREALPDAAAEIARGWSTLADARIGFLLFHVDLVPGQKRALVVRYDQRPTLDREAHVNPTYAFDYLLSPARRWAGFGPLDVSVRVPDGVRFTSAFPFHRDGDTYRAALPGLPAGELRFEAMSTGGLWFGMSDPPGYWAVLMAAMAAAVACVGWASGRLCGGASRWRRVLMPLVTAGPLAAVCSLALLVLLMSAFPPAALGFGYGGLVGGVALVLLSVPVGAVVGAASAARRRRASAGVATTD